MLRSYPPAGCANRPTRRVPVIAEAAATVSRPRRAVGASVHPGGHAGTQRRRASRVNRHGFFAAPIRGAALGWGQRSGPARTLPGRSFRGSRAGVGGCTSRPSRRWRTRRRPGSCRGRRGRGRGDALGLEQADDRFHQGVVVGVRQLRDSPVSHPSLPGGSPPSREPGSMEGRFGARSRARFRALSSAWVCPSRLVRPTWE
jgi:hypothetical protein